MAINEIANSRMLLYSRERVAGGGKSGRSEIGRNHGNKTVCHLRRVVCQGTVALRR